VANSKTGSSYGDTFGLDVLHQQIAERDQAGKVGDDTSPNDGPIDRRVSLEHRTGSGPHVSKSKSGKATLILKGQIERADAQSFCNVIGVTYRRLSRLLRLSGHCRSPCYVAHCGTVSAPSLAQLINPSHYPKSGCRLSIVRNRAAENHHARVAAADRPLSVDAKIHPKVLTGRAAR
jgi:hypothetical protein